MLSYKKEISVILAVVLIFQIVLFFNAKIEKINLDSSLIKTSKQINIGFISWPGFMLIKLADVLGYFEREGLDVKVIKYNSVPALDNDILTGKIDARTGYVSDTVSLNSREGLVEQIVLVTDYSLGGDALIARNGADDIRKHDKPRIAYSGSINFFLLWILDSLGIDSNKVEFVKYISEDDAYADFKSGKIDFMFTYVPTLYLAINEGATVVYSSKESPGLVMDMVSFRKDFILDHPSKITSFTKAYFNAYDFWEENKEASYKLVTPFLGIEINDFISQMDLLQLVSQEENINIIARNIGMKSIYSNFRVIHMLLSKSEGSRYLNNKYEDFVYTKAIKF